MVGENGSGGVERYSTGLSCMDGALSMATGIVTVMRVVCPEMEG